MKKIVYVTRKLPEKAIEPLKDKYEVRMWQEEGKVVPRDILLREVKDIHALWTVIADRVDEELFEAAPNLQVVSNMAVGYNNIDLEAAKKHNVTVTNTPDVLTETTADLAFTLLLATSRRIMEAEKSLRAGEWTSWTPMGYTGMDISGATLGIIGMGRIGEAVARRAKGFDMRVLYHNRTRKEASEQKYGFEYAQLEELLKEADFVVLLVPLTKETNGLIGKRELEIMKSTAVLINVARGGIVDETALYHALKNKQIWAAGLDVFEIEPVPLDNPLLTLPNVTVLPHIGSASIKTRQAMMALNAASIAAVLEGKETPNKVV